MGLFNRGSANSCSYCKSKITRKAPVSPNEGMVIGQKYAMGQVSTAEVENFYKSIGNNCPKCGKMSCAFALIKMVESAPVVARISSSFLDCR